jgi:hypothetical protein
MGPATISGLAVDIDDAKLAPRAEPMPVVEHRILAGKIEQLRAELVEKPLMMFGFVVCLRHAMLQTIPLKYFFHNRTRPSRPHRPRRGAHPHLGGRGNPGIRAPSNDGMREAFERAYGRTGPS